MTIKKPCLLIVDDNADLAYLLKKFFVNSGFNVSLANNGFQAIDFIKDNKIDILLTDLLMEKMDGLDLVVEAKKILPQVLCFVMTGFFEKSQARRSEELGVKALFVKPFNTIDALSKIQAALSL